MNDIDWPFLWKSVLLLSVVILFGLGFIVGAVFYQEDYTDQVKKIEQQIQALKSEKRFQDEQQKLMGKFRPRFRAYTVKGVFNQEPRLKWVENIKKVEALLKVPAPIRFKLQVRAPYVPTFQIPMGSYALYASPMELEFGLLHEGDLFNFFKRLKKNAHGIFDIKSCLINRKDKDSVQSKNLRVAVNLTANCKINWYTMRQEKLGGEES